MKKNEENLCLVAGDEFFDFGMTFGNTEIEIEERCYVVRVGLP
jgi:hypothetical protein